MVQQRALVLVDGVEVHAGVRERDHHVDVSERVPPGPVQRRLPAVVPRGWVGLELEKHLVELTSSGAKRGRMEYARVLETLRGARAMLALSS